MIVTFIMIGGVLGYKWGRSMFANPKVEEVLENLRKYVKEIKKNAKHQDDAQDNETTKKGINPIANALMHSLG